MPNRDGTGPLGQGPRTGRQLGTCAGATPLAGRGPQIGRGRGRGLGLGLGLRTDASSTTPAPKTTQKRAPRRTPGNRSR